MTDAKKQEFTLRIVGSNKSQMVVVLYDMFLEYLSDAEKSENDGMEMHRCIQSARGCLSELINSLNREYDVASKLYQLYRYVERVLIKADTKRNTENLSSVEGIMTKLRDAYQNCSKEDSSAPIMQHTETVISGMTYGKNEIRDAYPEAGSNRGFLC